MKLMSSKEWTKLWKEFDAWYDSGNRTYTWASQQRKIRDLVVSHSAKPLVKIEWAKVWRHPVWKYGDTWEQDAGPAIENHAKQFEVKLHPADEPATDEDFLEEMIASLQQRLKQVKLAKRSR